MGFRIYKWLRILFLLSFLIMASATLPIAVSATSDDAQQAERMLEIAEKAGVKVDAIFRLAEQKNVTITATSITARGEGDALLAQARTAYDAGNYTRSRQLAFSAMPKYRIAIHL